MGCFRAVEPPIARLLPGSEAALSQGAFRHAFKHALSYTLSYSFIPFQTWIKRAFKPTLYHPYFQTPERFIGFHRYRSSSEIPLNNFQHPL